MFVKKTLKCLGLFLASTVLMTGIIYLIAFFYSYIRNEYIAFGLMSVLYSAIVILLGYKLANKIRIKTVVYFLFTTLIPAAFYSAFLGNVKLFLNAEISISTNESELLYILLFLCITFAISTAIAAMVEVLKFYKNKKR